jgi:UDP-glucuronate decarboxylase
VESILNNKRVSKRILVAGGSGFLGSHLCDRLLTRGHKVICLDNLQTGRLTNIQHLLQNEDFEFIEHDIVEPISGIEVDQIYNLACAASPPRYQIDPIHTLKTNVYGSFNLLEIARECDATILQCSTSEVYGDPNVSPQPESYWGNVNPIGIRSCYDEGKRAAETLFSDFHRMNGVSVKIVRIFNTYGPRMDPNDGRVVSNFVNQVLQHQPVTLFGDGKQTRSFCYVSDLVDGIERMMESDPSIIGPVNLGNDHEITMIDLVDIIESIVGRPVDRTYMDLPADDPKHRKPDISLAKQTLDWHPVTSTIDGLKKTIRYFEQIQ